VVEKVKPREDATNEIKVIGIVVRNLESLPADSRRRVLEYVRAYFAADLSPAVVCSSVPRTPEEWERLKKEAADLRPQPVVSFPSDSVPTGTAEGTNDGP
jgi:hypothetical protein